MLKLADVDLNAVHRYANPSKESIKQRMMNQETVFQTQVYDLHRLYRTQLDLVEECKPIKYDGFCMKNGIEYGSFYLKNRSAPSTSSNQTDPAMYYVPEKERAVTASTGVVSMPPVKGDFLEKQYENQSQPSLSWSSFKKTCIDLHLPTDEFIRRANEDSLRNESRRNPLEASDRLNSSNHVTSGPVKKIRRGKKNCTVIPHDVIDLEDPSFGLSSERGYPTHYSGLAASGFTPGSKSQLGLGFTDTRSFVDIGPSCSKQTSLLSGFHGQESPIQCTDFSNKKPSVLCSPKPIDLDLNIPLVDPSLCSSNNSTVLNSIGGLSAVSQPVNPRDNSLAPHSGNSSISNFLQTSSQQQHKEVVDFNFKDDTKKKNLTLEVTTRTDGNGRKFVIIDLESPTGSASVCCEQKNGSPRSVGKMPDSIPSDEAEMEVDAAQGSLDKKFAEDAAFTHPSEGQMVSDDNELPKIPLALNLEGSPLSEPDQKSSESVESNDQCIDEKQDLVEVDELVKAAAEAIVFMSKQMQDGDNKPQYPCDSYELLVLNQGESGQEDHDHDVSSKTVEVSEAEKGGSRYKLKRGTRMKDFQKDVLPALSSLSRHEISEDVGVMENIMRSREFKRMRSKKASEVAWCTAKRSRRSRTNYRRRYYT